MQPVDTGRHRGLTSRLANLLRFRGRRKGSRREAITVSLVQQENDTKTVTVEAGNKEQLEAYNKKHGTDYLMLPPEMYEVGKEVVFNSKQTLQYLAGKVQGCEILLAGKLRLAGKTEGRYGTRD